MEGKINSELRIFCKESSGEALEKAIIQVLESEIYDFTLFTELASVKALGEDNKYFKSLKFFAEKNFLSEPSDLIQLTPKMKDNLKKIAIIDLAKRQKKLSFKEIMDKLDIGDKFTLNCFLIELIENQALTAKIDEKNEILKVTEVNTRFFGNTQEEISTFLAKWKGKIDGLNSFFVEQLEKSVETRKNIEERINAN